MSIRDKISESIQFLVVGLIALALGYYQYSITTDWFLQRMVIGMFGFVVVISFGAVIFSLLSKPTYGSGND